jgi:hypothetical protein
MKMKNQVTITLSLVFILAHSFAQKKDPLFNTKEPLDIGLTLSVKETKKTKGDTIYLSHKLYYHNQEKKYDTIRVGLKSGSQSTGCSNRHLAKIVKYHFK